ncbi:MAG: methylated-DNA--[protein]-cysteine S-methyltransferase [Pseudomonadota bacterium]|nr:methylated-DNA--[protein]-cysteine S-methyltransferase [Pseudomonadota bacterium]
MTPTTTYYDLFDTPAGEMIVVQDAQGVRHIDFQEGAVPLAIDPQWQRDPDFCRRAREQLQDYFDGELTRFDLPLAPRGTEFQQRVWAELAKVPFGETRSYGELAQALKQPTASRAVGMANGRNPLSIVLPCHRVVGSNRKLTGYRGGLAIKTLLLKLEGIPVDGDLIDA